MTPQADEDDPEQQSDLSNMASWYRRLIQEDPGRNAALTVNLQAVINDFTLLRFNPAGKSRLLMADFFFAPRRRQPSRDQEAAFKIRSTVSTGNSRHGAGSTTASIWSTRRAGR